MKAFVIWDENDNATAEQYSELLNTEHVKELTEEEREIIENVNEQSVSFDAEELEFLDKICCEKSYERVENIRCFIEKIVEKIKKARNEINK